MVECLYVVFNDQNNNRFGQKKNEIDHGFVGIDKGRKLVAKRYFIDLQWGLGWFIG